MSLYWSCGLNYCSCGRSPKYTNSLNAIWVEMVPNTKLVLQRAFNIFLIIWGLFSVFVDMVTFHFMYAFFARSEIFLFPWLINVFFLYAVQYWYERLCYSAGTYCCCFLIDIWPNINVLYLSFQKWFLAAFWYVVILRGYISKSHFIKRF